MSLPTTPPSLFLSRAHKIFSLTPACGPEGLLELKQLALNHLGYKGPLEVSSPISCLRQVQLVQVPQGHVQLSYEYIPGCRCHNFCQLLFKYLTTIMVKKSFLIFVYNLQLSSMCQLPLSYPCMPFKKNLALSFVYPPIRQLCISIVRNIMIQRRFLSKSLGFEKNCK